MSFVKFCWWKYYILNAFSDLLLWDDHYHTLKSLTNPTRKYHTVSDLVGEEGTIPCFIILCRKTLNIVHNCLHRQSLQCLVLHRFSRKRTWVEKCSQKLCTIAVLVRGVTQKLDPVILLAMNSTLHEPQHKVMAHRVLTWPTCYSESSCIRWNTEASLIKHTSVGCITSARPTVPVHKIRVCCIICVAEFVNHICLIWIQTHQCCWISCCSRRLARLPCKWSHWFPWKCRQYSTSVVRLSSARAVCVVSYCLEWNV